MSQYDEECDRCYQVLHEKICIHIWTNQTVEPVIDLTLCDNCHQMDEEGLIIDGYTEDV
jgi:hypothetical protein